MTLQPLLVRHDHGPTLCVQGGQDAAQARARALSLRDWAEMRWAAIGGPAFVRDSPGAGPYVHLPTRAPVALPPGSAIATDALAGGISLAVPGVPFEEWRWVARVLRQEVEERWAARAPTEFHPDDDCFHLGTVTLPVRPRCGGPAVPVVPLVGRTGREVQPPPPREIGAAFRLMVSGQGAGRAR